MGRKDIDIDIRIKVKDLLRKGRAVSEIAQMEEIKGKVSLNTIYRYIINYIFERCNTNCRISNNLSTEDCIESYNRMFSHDEKKMLLEDYLKNEKPEVISVKCNNGVILTYILCHSRKHFPQNEENTSEPEEDDEPNENDAGKESEEDDSDDEEDHDNNDAGIEEDDSDDEEDQVNYDTGKQDEAVDEETSPLFPSFFQSFPTDFPPDSSDTILEDLLHYEKKSFRNNFNLSSLSILLQTIGGTVEEGIILLLRLLHKQFRDSFMKAIKTLGLVSQQLSVEETLGLKSYAVLTNTQLKAIARFLKNRCKTRILASYKKILAYKKSLYLPIQRLSFTTNNGFHPEDLNYESSCLPFLWVKPQDVIKVHLNLMLQIMPVQMIFDTSAEFGQHLPVIFSADFGHKDTKLAMTMNHPRYSYIIGLYEDKDSSSLFEKTLAPLLDEAIDNLFQSKLLLSVDDDNKITVTLAENFTNASEAISIPIIPFFTGDLKFLFALHGREHYCGSNCLFCFSKPSQWKDSNFEGIRIVTVPSDSEVANKFGFKYRQLLPSLPLPHYVLPVLHSKLGVVDIIYHSIKQFIAYILPTTKMMRIDEEMEILKDMVKLLTNQLSEVQRIKGETDAKISERDENYIQQMSRKRKSSPLNKSEKKRKLGKEDTALKQQLKHKEAEVKKLEHFISATEKQMKILEKEGKKEITAFKHFPLEQRINNIFRKYGVVEQQYHGNCLIGEHCHRLLVHSHEILKEIKELLLQFRSTFTVKNANHRINEQFYKFEEIMRTLDVIFAITYRDQKATDQDSNQMDKLCAKFGLLWRDYYKCEDNDETISHLTPKFHLIEKHLPETYRRFRTLYKFIEETIERIHHEWKIYSRIYQSITDWNERSIMIIQDMMISASPAVNRVVQQVNQDTKRKPRNKINKLQELKANQRKEVVDSL